MRADRRGQQRTPRARRLLAAWLGLLVLAVNLFGWHGTAPGHGAMMAGMAMDGMCDMTAMPPPTDGDSGSSHSGRTHDDLLCPACFPLGCTASGALAATAPQLVRTGATVIATLPVSQAGTLSGRQATPYRARGPPIVA